MQGKAYEKAATSSSLVAAEKAVDACELTLRGILESVHKCEVL